MKIGIYGGTFDPIHRGHLSAAEAAARVLGLDQVLLVPDALPPHKELSSGSASGQQRYEMAELALYEARCPARVLDTELRRGGVSYTCDTLRQLKEPCEVRLCSDSQYVINGLEKGWAKGWKRRGWKKSDGSPALNPDLWEQALEQEARHKITYVWVKGHAGHPENERCDQLAVAQSQAHGGRQGR